jgi:dihydrofolate synthase/folylpolyglutamate synthase
VTLSSDYQSALDIIFNYVDYERRRSVPYTETAWNLDRARRALAALGDPHVGKRFVHVAGSKGKGSTAANIESILRAAGLRTGFYTSPHLHTFRERIRIDGQLIDRGDVVRLLAECLPAVEDVPGITTFEIITVMALLHFAQQQVDWVVLEVGLGGRLDATNVVTPAVSVITPISYEHTALLGNTLDLIAREKAGIIKPGVPVVVAPQKDEALAAIQSVADQQNAPLILAGRDWVWRGAVDSLDGQVFDVARQAGPGPSAQGALSEPPWGGGLRALYTPLLGPHQLDNATVAVATCGELVQRGVAVGEQAVRAGLAGVVWPGRLEVLGGVRRGDGHAADDIAVVDSAHNDASARLLRTALAHYFPDRPITMILGVSNDKDARAILAELLPGVARVSLTRSRHPRAADPQDLAPLAAQYVDAERLTLADSVAEALDWAEAEREPGVVICLTGSLFIAGEGREAWLARHPGGLPAGDWAYEAEPPAPDWQISQRPLGAQAPVYLDSEAAARP